MDILIDPLPDEIVTFSTRSESYESVDKQRRYSQILEIMTESDKPLTAKEIAVIMRDKGYVPTAERNFVSPRLTELSKKGLVNPCGKKRCQYTGKTVAVYEIRNRKGN